MKAIVQKRYGPPERALALEEVDRPSVGDDDVLIRVRATSVNTPDWIAVTGVPYVLRLRDGLRRPRTPVRGTDVAGDVEAVGANVIDLQPGDEVFGSLWDSRLTAHPPGTFAELTVAPASKLVEKPAGLTFEEAAASVMSGLTALIAVRDVGRVGSGTRLLVNGASGGVGTFAVQIAKALGAEVTGVCGTGNLELVRSLGADHVVDYTQEDFTRADQRYDVLLDNVLNHPPSATARVLTPAGTLIPNSVGNTGGFFAGLPRMARAALLGRRGSTDVRFVTCVVDREHLDALAALLESGDVKVVIDRVYPLAEAANAVALMLGHHATGKVVIAVQPRRMVAAADGRAVVLVEGTSDRAALEALATRRGRDLAAEGVSIVPIGGAKNIGKFLDLYGPRGQDLRLAGLCDAAEERDFRRGLERAGLGSDLSRADMERLGFYVCVQDLEDELIRSLGTAAVERVLDAQGELRSFRTLQKQPAQQGLTTEAQLRRFMGTRGGRKIQYGALLVGALDLADVPRPLDRVLAHV